MSDTVFVNGVTLTDQDWFNDVNRLHYTIFGDPSTIVAALTNIRAVGQGTLLNGVITATVGSNALTLAVKGQDGNDPSASNPVTVAMRSATASSGSFNIRSITGALSMVVSSGSTLGHASAIAQHVFVYLIDNAGTLELAASNLPPDYPGVFGKARLVSTTAEGGAGAADSATGVYSTTARSNVPWICVAKILTTQTTAGTWAAAITQIDQSPFVIPSCGFRAVNSNTQSIAYNTNTTVELNVETIDFDNTFSTATYRHQPNVAGMYNYMAIAAINNLADGGVLNCTIAANGAAYEITSLNNGTTNAVRHPGHASRMMNGTSDYITLIIYQADSGMTSRNLLDGSNMLTGCRYVEGQS